MRQYLIEEVHASRSDGLDGFRGIIAAVVISAVAWCIVIALLS